MAKTLLEEMISQTKATKDLLKENAKTILAATTKEVLKESLEDLGEDADEESPYEETDVDDTGEEVAPADEEGDETGDGMTASPAPEPEVGDTGEADMTDVVPLDATGVENISGEETLDLTNASREEVMAAIANAPDDAKIVLVKKPAFDVSFETTETEPMIPDMGQGDTEEVVDQVPMDEPQMGDETEVEDEPPMGDETDEEKDKPFGESNLLKVKNQQLKLYEGKIEKLKEAVKILIGENESLKQTQTQYVSALNEAKKSLNEVALTNVNLMHVTMLFTEGSVTRTEKEDILKEFDQKVTTINESKLLFESWQRVLTKAPLNPPNQLDRGKLNETTVVEKKSLNESKSYQKPVMSDFDRIAGYTV